VKLMPDRTGLLRTVWITENQGYSARRARQGQPEHGPTPSRFPSVRTVRRSYPPGRQPELPAADLALVCRWVVLNRDVILDFWNGAIDCLGAGARLQQLP
jgi:hypothetical protein